MGLRAGWWQNSRLASKKWWYKGLDWESDCPTSLQHLLPWEIASWLHPCSISTAAKAPSYHFCPNSILSGPPAWYWSHHIHSCCMRIIPGRSPKYCQAWRSQIGLSLPPCSILHVFFFFNCSIIDLQCCISFCYTINWVSYMYTYIPCLLGLPPIHHTLLGHHRKPSWLPCAIQ